MVIISKFRQFLRPQTIFKKNHRNAGGTINIEPTGYAEIIGYDRFHFYTCIGFAPIFLFGGLMSLFVGDAVLVDTPDDYEPEDWECERNPVQRLLQRYLFTDHTYDHEWRVAKIAAEQDSRIVKMLIDQVKRTQMKYRDYRAWYFQPTLLGHESRADRLSSDSQSHYKDVQTCDPEP